MRWAILGVLLAAAGRGEARPEPPPAADDSRGDFWRDVLEPNADRVNALVSKARQTLQNLDGAMLNSDNAWAVDQKARFFRAAYDLSRYARKLSPEHTDALALLGRAADELGKTREAIDALETCIRILGPAKAGTEVTGRLGAIYLRLGQRDTAIRWLRHAQGPLPIRAPYLVHLAHALAERGELTEAVELLAGHTATQGPSMYGHDGVALVAFGLAVIYDRDEQRGAAFDVLERLQSTMQQQYASQLHNELAKMRFAPAEDRHYYQALLYESLGHYIEARAEWALYAAISDAPWRKRALDHIAEIDQARRTQPAARPAPTPNPIPIRRPRP